MDFETTPIRRLPGLVRIFHDGFEPRQGINGPRHMGGAGLVASADVDGDQRPDFVFGSWGNSSLQARVEVWTTRCDGSLRTVCNSFPNSTGSRATLLPLGSPSLGVNDLVLAASDAPPGRPGLFFVGTTEVFAPFGDGVRCVGGQTKRLGPPQFIDANGSATRRVELDAPPFTSGPLTLTPGSELYFQFWFRDPVGPGGSGFNLTDAAAAVFCD